MQSAASVLSRSTVAAAVMVLGACATTDYHYSQLLGERYYRATIDTYPVSVVRVDGRDNTRRPALVDPGVREVSVQGPPGGSGGFGDVQTISLSVAPCTRYYLVAVKTQRLASDFTVRVDHQEPVSGCSPPPAS